MNLAVRTMTATMLALVTSLTADDEVRRSEWILQYLDVTEAHQHSRGLGVVVGLPDSGVSPHPDLQRNLLRGIDASTGLSKGAGTDELGHGTGLAGLIVGHGHNPNSGILGIAPEAQLLPVIVYTQGGSAESLDRGIRLSVENGARVINVSASIGPSAALTEAVNLARNADALIVASVGNSPTEPLPGYPASIPGVLAVGAISRDGGVAEFSLPGTNVSICAPGSDITTTGKNNTYVKVNGTSAAAAIVSGAAALVRARFPELSAPEVAHRLTATATDIGPPGRDDECGFGVLNIVKALTADVPPLTGPGSPAGSTTNSRSPDAGNDERSSLPLGVILTAGAGIAGIGTLVVFFALRRRRAP